jgi:hypothetical protein
VLPSHHWARNFSIEPDDIDTLINLLLEKEAPLTIQQLMRVLIENRLDREYAALEERFKDVHVYNPEHHYDVGSRIAFPAFSYSTAMVTGVRSGTNDEYGPFSVIAVKFDEDESEREFASEFEPDHVLKTADTDGGIPMVSEDITVDDIVAEVGAKVSAELEASLQQNDSLVCIVNQWFPVDLILEINDGHLNLVEAVLDIMGGGPLPTDSMIEQIGGLSAEAPMSLQTFSLNYVLNDDPRFDEVGPAGEVLWYLNRMAPTEVKQGINLLQYQPVDYDRNLLDADALTLEREIGDELSPLTPTPAPQQGTVILNYAHRRAGTLPLSPRIREIFPTARSAAYIWITLVDPDGEEHTGWVLPDRYYVSGLTNLYEKYQLPIGAYVTVRQLDEPDKVQIDLVTHKPRTEWVRLLQPRGETVQFENTRRSIGADFDDLMIIGIDDLEALDAFLPTTRRKTLAALLRMVIPELGRLTPQGAAHVRTIYSAINVLRRYPPGPILATLAANPDFENLGGHYWKLAE